MRNFSTSSGYVGSGIDSSSTPQTEVDDVESRVEQSAQYRAQYQAYVECVRNTFSKPYPADGQLYCNRTFDGWGCWEDTLAGKTAIIACPSDVITAFDPSIHATKYCTVNGTWWLHPDSNAPWSDYTACINKTELESSTRTLYVYIIGYSISVVTLLISLFIFCYFRQLQCERITLHRNLFLSYTLCALTWIFYYLAVNMNTPVLKGNPVWCRGLHIIAQYFTASNFLWMLCEGFYLHTKLVFAFVSGQKLLLICRFIGWLLPVLLVLIYSVSRATADTVLNKASCWVRHSPLQWIVFVPIILSIFLNLVFLCNIVRLLVTKLRALNSTDANQTKQATRATLILIPLLGIQFVFFMFQPSAESPGRYVYVIFSALTISLQGFFVSVIYCFFNGEVLSVVRRKWHQRQLMKGRRDTGTMWTISYTHGEERQSIATTTTEMRRSSSSYDRRLDSSYKLNGVKSTSESKHMLSETEGD